ncbi:MAG: hypothetical protein OXF56_02180, partial [Rhodobacteraceae bacterium]|nr:hypothetical protein [Paracoccaceae bacterium]
DVDHGSIKAGIWKLYGSTGREPEFSRHGPDIVAVSEHEWWCIECKGTGTGKPSTQRNNFDRALASVVSYYEDDPQAPVRWAKDARVFLGLALPASPQYLKELARRVRSPLRRRLNLWILLYEKSVIRAVAPAERF